ncbi:hypothetical protein UFOVP49_143 [uncultured Caudovirales phage]|uniref:Uncharacterized protein n=1 Tax=uncultured Caudovirales phage TaxID=2100421 RepID=A0A6J5KT53_9CAUD|nr:hypothetical protein UFOVP49_143 [uncultured Caudovirales phage]
MATTTVLAETAQALFCAIRGDISDVLAKKLFTEKTYESFKASYQDSSGRNVVKDIYRKQVKSKVNMSDVEKFLINDPSWYLSSKQIALEILDKIKTISKGFGGSVNWQDFLYYQAKHSDVSDTIEKMFKAANKQLKEISDPGMVQFSSIDRWCPADIYFVSRSGIHLLKSKENTINSFAELNPLISEMITNGDLLPVSLKKQPRKVTIEKVNFDRNTEVEKLSKYDYYGISENLKVSLNVDREANPAKYFAVKVDRDGTEDIMFRFSDSSKSFKIERIYKNQARGGSVASIPTIKKLFNSIDPSFCTKFSLILKQFKDSDEESAGMEATSKFKKLFKQHFDSNKEKSRELVHILLEYTGSRTELSSKYIVAK